METLAALNEEELGETFPWDEAAHPMFDEELDVLAFELWQQGSRQDVAAEDDPLDEEILFAAHSSCL